MNTRDKAIELIKENFTDRDLMVELKGSDLVYQAVLKTVQQALNIDLVSKSFKCCKESDKCSVQCDDCNMVYNY